MPHTYRHTTAEQHEQVAATVAARDEPTPITPALLTAWELEHYAHGLLLERAVAAGDDETAEAHRAAQATIEAAIAAAEPPPT